MKEFYSEILHKRHKEQAIEKRKRYRRFINEDPKALITLFFMEDIYEERDYPSMLIMYGPPASSVDELLDYYNSGKHNENFEGENDDLVYRHENYDDKIEKIYRLWKSQISGNETVDEKIEILQECYLYFKGGQYIELITDKRRDFEKVFREKKIADIIELNYPLLDVAYKQLKERKEYTDKYLIEDPKAIVTLWIMEKLYNEEAQFPSPYPLFVLAGPPYHSTREIYEFYETHKNNGGCNFDEEINQILSLWEEKNKYDESVGNQKFYLKIAFNQILFPDPGHDKPF